MPSHAISREEFLEAIRERDGVLAHDLAVSILSCSDRNGYRLSYCKTDDGKLSCKLSIGDHTNFFDFMSNRGADRTSGEKGYKNFGLWFTISAGKGAYETYAANLVVGKILKAFMERWDTRENQTPWRSAKIAAPDAADDLIFVLGAFAAYLTSIESK